MKKVVYFILLFQVSLFAQSDEEMVRSTIMNYIEGSANGDINRLKSAFHSDANLYFVRKDSLSYFSSKRYFTFFKEGEKNGRQGHIVSIDVVNNAAIGVVQVDMPSYKLRYTDHLLLLKVSGEWKIIHKSYTSESYERKGKVLFVVSNESSFGDNKRLTGTHYGELVQPYHNLQKEGYEVDFVSPLGGDIPVAYINLQNPLQRQYFYDAKLQYKLKNTLSPSQVKAGDYDAVFYCGGSAPVFDIPNNKSIQEITRKIYEDKQGIIGAVCHGAAGIVNVKLSNGEYLVKGKKISAFTNNEESNSKLLPFLVENKLKERGAIYGSAPRWKSHVEVDGRLVTGQNPFSLEVLSKKMIEALNSKIKQQQ